MQTGAVDWVIWTVAGTGEKTLKLKHSCGSITLSSMIVMLAHCRALLESKKKLPDVGT